MGARSAFAVTASASAQPRRPQMGVWVATAGDVTVKFSSDGPSVTFGSVPAGTLLPISPVIISACPANTVAL